MVSTGRLIWISCRPLIRLVLCTGSGFAITKLDIFPAVASRGAGQIVLQIGLPCLLFSKIIPAFSSENLSSLGPLVLVALLYKFIGIALAWLIKQVCWVPHRFRYGILVAGGWGNEGDIPAAVVMAVTASAPFIGLKDQNLSVAYCSAFILVFMVTLFPLGGQHWIKMDFVGPDIENTEVRENMRRKRRRILRFLRITSGDLHTEPQKDLERSSTLDDVPEKHVSFVEEPSRPPSEVPTHTIVEVDRANEKKMEEEIRRVTSPESTTSPPPTLSQSPIRQLLLSTHAILIAFFTTLISPASLSMIISFPISVIPTLKNLFVSPPTASPSHEPPLAFLLDSATFIGNASVPLGLICLGSALARMQLPRFSLGLWKKEVPMGAVVLLALARMVVMPIIGISLCEGVFVPSGFINKEDKVLRFVCIFFSCLPTATTQVYLTQVFNATGSADHLPVFLIPQYILMFFTMTALTALSLNMIF